MSQSSEELVLQTERFQVTRVTSTRPNGRVLCREVIRHPGSVVLLPIVDAEHICLIRNHRLAAGQTLIELPAGTREPHEPADVCAARELREETGYDAGHLEELTDFYAAPGILDEWMHLFVASDLTAGPPAREPTEEIENYVVSWNEALRMIRAGEIRDAKTIVGVLYYHQFRRS